MAKNTIEYNFIGEPSDKLKCLICLDVAKEPKQHDKCGKIFCCECIEMIKEEPCPACKTDKPNYFTDSRAAQEIRDLAINCKNLRAGCSWKGTVATLPDHVTSCECEVVSCKYNYVGCDVKKMKKDMKSHEEEDDKHHLHLALQSVAIPTLSHGDKFVFKVTDYSVKKHNNEVFTSNSFYTHTNGYKMCVKVYLNGTGSGAGTHVSVSTCILQGPFDRSLKWPFTWSIKLDIIDQIRGQCNTSTLMRHNINQSGGHYTEDEFFPHLSLEEDPVLLHNDTIYFCVGVENRDELPWLECGVQSHHKLVNMGDVALGPIVFKHGCHDHLKRHKLHYKYPFYSSRNGYHMELVAYSGGDGGGEGTHVSVFIHLLRGSYDSTLSWPFKGKVKIELLNQLADENHYSSTIEKDMNIGDSWGYPEFIKHDQLQNGNKQFLMNDNLYFRLMVLVGEEEYKPWLLHIN